MEAFQQGYFDSLCGIYSIINADKIVNNSTETESHELFYLLIDSLDYRGKLRDVIIEGSDHSIMKLLLNQIVNYRFPLRITNKRGIIKLNDWWQYSRQFLEDGKNRAIILSIGGKEQHLTVVERMTDRVLYLKDSSIGWKTIKKSTCRMIGYTETDKYIIYPSQCWYLGKE